MEIAVLFRTLSCMLVAYGHEGCKSYPSDPLASNQLSRRTARLLDSPRDGGHLGGFDFPKGMLDPVVKVENGKLEGYVMRSIKGRSIYAFEGVPYAETTAGANRFKLPVPKAPWAGIRPAKAPGPYCIQRNPFQLNRIIGSEDCLFMNIYVPAEPIRNGTGNLPVIVFIHGGSWFMSTGAEYGPAYLLEHDVIYVNINFRQSIFGFMSTGDENMPGNLGMKDQRSALKWVYENIANFGGDPSRITITGYSAGAASVHYHMLAKSSHKYFSGAVSISGNAFCPWTLMSKKQVEERNRKISKATNCPLTNSKAFVDCLRKVSARGLVRASKRLFEFFNSALPGAPLSLVIEDDRPGAFLTEHPLDIYTRNGVAKVPFIVSSTSEEIPTRYAGVDLIQSLYFTLVRESGSFFKKQLKKILPIGLEYKYAPNADSISEKIMDFYFRNNGKARVGNFTAFGQLAADRLMGYGVHTTIQRHSQVAPTYSYFYDYHSRNNGASRFTGFDPKKVGVGHTDDLTSIFNITVDGNVGYKTTDPEYAVVKLMTSLFYNFAARREPLYTDEEGNDMRIWEPVTDPRNIRVLQINEDVKMIPEQYTDRLKFWETVDLPDILPLVRFDS